MMENPILQEPGDTQATSLDVPRFKSFEIVSFQQPLEQKVSMHLTPA